MTTADTPPEAARWQLLNDLFHAAIGRDAAQREAFLADACGGDAQLRADVERLLRAHEQVEALPTGALAGEAAPDAATLAPGTHLGPYEIAALLGAGGMGEVYRARDTRLGRTVAIKVLRSGLARSAAIRQRFDREARAISALSHPHICTLHDVGQQDGIDYLVMEYLEGETLDERLRKGPLLLSQALRYGIEIAHALDFAHRNGVVHRDLKPANVMITKSGTKLLDFGIAKLKAGSTAEGLPSAATPLTDEGTILGTFQYMSPEQLEGGQPDARSDIFAFGSVLHEMVTGQRAFNGKSQASLIAAILAGEPPPVSRFQPLSPPALDRVVAKCLAKEPDDRWQSAGDLASELEWLAGSSSSTAGAPATRARRREWAAWALAAALGVAALVIALRWRDEQRPVSQAVTASLVPPPGIAYGFDAGYGPPALSPDGGRVAFIGVRPDGTQSLWIRELSRPTAHELGETSGASYPFWSPDSRRIAFFSRGRLQTIDAGGGNLATVCNVRGGRGGAWGPGDVILFAGQFDRIQRVSATGGTPEVASSFADLEGSHRFPQFLPKGRFLYVAFGGGVGTKVCVGRLGSTETRVLLKATPAALYADPGWILFWRGRGLLAQRLNVDTFELEGEPIPLAEPVRAFLTTFGSTVASVAGTQALVYQEGLGEFHAQLTWFDRTGRRLGDLGPPGDGLRPSLSHDGRRLAADILDPSQVQSSRDLWIFDPGRAVPTRFTFEPGNDRWATWSPDDRRIAYSSNSESSFGVYTKETTGTVAPELMFGAQENHLTSDWSEDGRFLALQTLVRGGATSWDVSVYSFAEKQVRPFLQSLYSETTPHFSPDGRWMAYASDESGRSEVYVQPFPGPGAKFQVSTSGGGEPRWRRDGRELFYREPNGRFMAVPTALRAGSLEAGAPQPLFDARTIATPGTHYDVTADGQKFIVDVPVAEEEASPLTLVLNWPALLGR